MSYEMFMQLVLNYLKDQKRIRMSQVTQEELSIQGKLETGIENSSEGEDDDEEDKKRVKKNKDK
jgi:ABC-type Zn2+ transport system substrate-binding protein/surface adhesin